MIRDDIDDDLRGNIITAATNIARSLPGEEPRVVSLIGAIAPDAGDNSVHHAVTTMMFHADDLTPALIEALTQIAHKVRAGNIGTLEHLDNAAAQLLRRDRVDEALSLVVPLLSQHDEFCSLEHFDGFAHSLLSLDRAELAHIVAKWLLSLDRNLGEATRNLVSSHHGDESVLFEFDAKTLAITEDDTIVLAHRAIGYLFLHPITAASFVLSLVDTVSPPGRQAIEDILFEPLLINFSGDLSAWLRAKAADQSAPIVPTVERLLARLDNYLDGLRRIGRINELRPSEREQLIESHRRHESMLLAHREAQKRSILMSIVSRSVLLYGTRSISYFHGPAGDKQRHEMKLHTFSHSFEAPRLDIIEPFELDYTLRVFRSMRIAP